MIEIALILASAVLTLAEFWEETVNFLKDTIQKAKKIIDGILFGTKVFVQSMGGAIQEIARHYSKKGNQWRETVYTREISPSEVPPDILEKAKRAEQKNSAADITRELEMELLA